MNSQDRDISVEFCHSIALDRLKPVIEVQNFFESVDPTPVGFYSVSRQIDYFRATILLYALIRFFHGTEKKTRF